MIELPEAVVMAKQINESCNGKKIKRVVAAQSPHKFAWFNGDPQSYDSLLAGKVIGAATNRGGLVEVAINDCSLLLGDGVNLRFYSKEEPLPNKHQLLIAFEDGSSLVGSVQMYGGMWAFMTGSFNNKYYLIAKEKPSPFSELFDRAYFDGLFDQNTIKLSLKAFLATEQRIPGLGNGVLQDIVFNAKMHPKKKVNTLAVEDKKTLLDSLMSTLNHMVAQGGRDTEADLYGHQGGYRTILSRNTVNTPCPVCGTKIKKEAYLGGSIYYCPFCQRT